MKNKIILFGYTGFLGKHLKNRLEGQVIPINYRGGDWRASISEYPDVFINCIGKAHDHKGTASTKDYFDSNLIVVKEIYKQFVASNAELFIHISSIAAVEETESPEIITEDSNCHPVSPYGTSKRAAENFLLAQTVPSGKKIIILRPTMIHGEGDKGNLKLLYSFIVKKVPYPLGAYENLRTFASIENVIYIINKIVKKKDVIPSGIYNICDDSSLPSTKIIEIIGVATNAKPIIWAVPKQAVNLFVKIGEFLSLPIDSTRLQKMTSNLIVSNQKIKSALGIEKLPLTAEEGLMNTIKSFKK